MGYKQTTPKSLRLKTIEINVLLMIHTFISSAFCGASVTKLDGGSTILNVLLAVPKGKEKSVMSYIPVL